jgi:hypothetical protein
MGVSKVTDVADSAPSLCELLSFVLMGSATFELCRKHFLRDGRRANRKLFRSRSQVLAS